VLARLSLDCFALLAMTVDGLLVELIHKLLGIAFVGRGVATRRRPRKPGRRKGDYFIPKNRNYGRTFILSKTSHFATSTEPTRMSPSSPRPLVVRRTAHERDERRIRIMGMVRSGFSYESIASDEQLSRERVRQIVVVALAAKGGTPGDHMRVQRARLEPALRLAARGVENGKLSAIPQLLRVLDRLDKFDAVADAAPAYDDKARERLLAKLDRVAARLLDPLPEFAVQGQHAAAGGANSEDKNLENDKSDTSDLDLL
jgi:hypothetical protein